MRTCSFIWKVVRQGLDKLSLDGCVMTPSTGQWARNMLPCNSTIVQSTKAATVLLKSKQLHPFGSAQKYPSKHKTFVSSICTMLVQRRRRRCTNGIQIFLVVGMYLQFHLKYKLNVLRAIQSVIGHVRIQQDPYI